MIQATDELEYNTPSTPVGAIALKLLCVAASYMAFMNLVFPGQTVFKSQFNIKGDVLQGLLVFVAMYSFASLVIRALTAKKPKSAVQQAVDKAIYQEVRGQVMPGAYSWSFPNNYQKTQIQYHVINTKKLLHNQVQAKGAIESAANLTLQSKKPMGTFVVSASQTLSQSVARAVDISQEQETIKRIIMKNLWTDDIKKAAGRLIQAASLKLKVSEYDEDYDENLVAKTNIRAKAILNETNRILLENKRETIENAISQALISYPAEKIDTQQKSLTMNTIKEAVSQKYWTDAVLIQAGNIAAARSVDLEPEWEDVEATRKADITGRKVADKMERTPDLSLTDAIKRVETEIQNADLIKYTLKEKVKAYVWTADPDLNRFKLKNKAGLGGISPEVRYILGREEIKEGLIFDQVLLLLEEKADKRSLPESHEPSFNPQKATDFHLTEEDVTYKLIQEANNLVKEYVEEDVAIKKEKNKQARRT